MKYNLVFCKECKRLTLHCESEVGCEDCGSHPALLCLVCCEAIDLIYESPTTYSVYREKIAEHRRITWRKR